MRGMEVLEGQVESGRGRWNVGGGGVQKGEGVGGGEWVQVDGRCKGRWREWEVREGSACR